MRAISFDLLYSFSFTNIFFHSVHNIVGRILSEHIHTGIDFRIPAWELYLGRRWCFGTRREKVGMELN